MRIKFALLVLVFASLACTANMTTLNTPTSPAPTSSQTTTDGVQASPTPSLASQAVVLPEAISKIHMLDPQNGWMITDTSVLQTQDGGVTWQDITPPGVSALGSETGASFLDLNRGWVLIGDAIDPVNKGMLYRTTDGGMTWASYITPFGGGDLRFLDDTNGWMMFSGESLWVKEPAQFFSTPFEGVKFFQSTDGGANWTQVYTNMPDDAGAGDSLPYRGFKTGFTPISLQEAWVSGLTNAINDFYLYHTMDGGHTWSLADYKLSLEERYQIDPPVFFNAQLGILPFHAGSEGTGLWFSLTADGGKTWTEGNPVSGTSYYSVISPYDIFVWADSRPVVSKDSGRSWTRIDPNVNLRVGLLQLQFVDVQTGWVVTRDNTNGHTSLYKTTDGGQTWIAQVE